MKGAAPARAQLEEELSEMYLQIVSTPAAYPLLLVVLVPLEWVCPITPATFVDVVYETAVVMVRVTFEVEAPTIDCATVSTYSKTPQ